MGTKQFQKRLQREFEIRRERNPRYSLRALASFLSTDHSTLSQIFRGKRMISASQIRQWSRKLGMSAEEAAIYVAEQHVPDLATGKRQEQLRHWTAEALSIANDSSH